MRALSVLFVLALLTAAACSNRESVKGLNPGGPTPPAVPGGGSSFAGTWTGSASDSSGSMMGSGLGSMTWTLAQTGTQVTGAMSFLGMTPGQANPTIIGTVSGSTMNFSITMPVTSMPPPFGACSATAAGTATLSANGASMTGTYTGNNTCVGGFAGGQLSLIRQ